MRGAFVGVPIIRIVYSGLYWGPLILGNYQVPQQHLSYHIMGSTLNPKP